ncbi:Uncharacterized protein APZ42_004719 [Daphnia magna]|uniref:Helitron helicase-like domain-containing protein n=1 Tax=Daphnia magna TaxID=35525 RepID=A0A164GVQ9_9CRUS|nr:Uncharacterized protein APZ42_004719 [Daphnia magna]
MSIQDYFNIVLAGGSLTQQWTVDSYVKIEANHVKYINEHQVELHVAQYNGFLDYLHNRAERENLTVGSYHVLPSSFIGSPRARSKRTKMQWPSAGNFATQYSSWRLPATKVEGNHGQHSQLFFGIRSTRCSHKSLPGKED